eukprot:8972533-Alexandrium_andersonii.AAC.1
MVQIQHCYGKRPQSQVEEVDPATGRILWRNSKSGRPDVEQRPLNIREQGAVVGEYRMSILEHGA